MITCVLTLEGTNGTGHVWRLRGQQGVVEERDDVVLVGARPYVDTAGV